MRVIDDLLTFIGITNGSGRWYLWWSGIVGDIGLFGGGFLIYRKHECHVHRCWRVSRHVTPEGHAVHLHETRNATIVSPPSDGT